MTGCIDAEALDTLGTVITAASGWCAPGKASWSWGEESYRAHVATQQRMQSRIEAWPTGLTNDDIAWLTRMMHVAEIEPETWDVQQGGTSWPM